MPLFRITVKHRVNTNGVRLEPGMSVDVVTNSNIGRKGDKTLLINIASEAAFFPTRRATCFATRPVFLQMKTIVSHTHHETLITSCTCAVCTSPCSLPSSCALLHGAHSLVKVFV